MAVCEVIITDAAIKRALSDMAVSELKEPRFPVRLRINRARTGGSWFLVSYVGARARWRKLASWPLVAAKTLHAELPRLMLDESATVQQSQWQTLGELLRWFLDRSQTDKSLSDKRRANIKSAIDVHLIPRVGDLPLAELSHRQIDELLLWPLQQRYSLATVRHHFAVLKRATKQAAKLRHLCADPLAAHYFKDFIPQPLPVRDATLQPKDLPWLLGCIQQASMPTRVLSMVLLALGTRLGETRRLAWSMFDMGEQGLLVVPPSLTKTRSEHRLPMTPWLARLLRDYRQWQNLHGYAGPWLFPAGGGKTHWSDRYAGELLRKLGQGKWTAHQLRKLARTCWADLGIDYIVAEQLLNHALTKLDRAYIHTFLEAQKRSALVLWHTHLEELMVAVIADADQDNAKIAHSC